MSKEIKEYIKQFPSEIQDRLVEIYEVIKKEVPSTTTEKISWQMPTFYLNENLVHFAANKNHVGFYPGAEAIVYFTDEIKKLDLKFSKGAIQFNYQDELPKDLIKRIVKHRLDKVKNRD